MSIPQAVPKPKSRAEVTTRTATGRLGSEHSAKPAKFKLFGCEKIRQIRWLMLIDVDSRWSSKALRRTLIVLAQSRRNTNIIPILCVKAQQLGSTIWVSVAAVFSCVSKNVFHQASLSIGVRQTVSLHPFQWQSASCNAWSMLRSLSLQYRKIHLF